MPTITFAEFAELAGVTVPVLRQWKKADPKFPAQVNDPLVQAWSDEAARAYLDGLIDGDQFAALLGISPATLLVRRSGDPDFPDVAVRRNRAPLWHLEDASAYRDRPRTPRDTPEAPPSEFVTFAEFAAIAGTQISLLHRQKAKDPAFPPAAVTGGKTSYWWRADAEAYRDYRAQLRRAPASDVEPPAYSKKKAAVVDSKGFAKASGLSLSSVGMYRLSDPAFPTPAIPGRYPYWWKKDARDYRKAKASRRSSKQTQESGSTAPQH
ncbi:hypothetical protein [Leifsonia shinshuensis]